jgi:probable O-glycosylation ligase (exosortase A-associated)
MRQAVFILAYSGLLPLILVSPFAGVLVYKWLELMPPEGAYYVYLLPGRLSLVVAALTFLSWLLKEEKGLPTQRSLILVLAALFLWINLTSLFALAPNESEFYFKWDRTVKVVGISILTAQMMSSRARIEAFVWVEVICVGFSAVSGAIKTILSGGGGFTVLGVPGSLIEERNAFALFLAMIMPLALFLGLHSTLLQPARWIKWTMQGIAFSCMVAIVGTYSRGGFLAGSAALLMLNLKAKHKIWGLVISCALVLVLVDFAPESWLHRMDTTIDYGGDRSATSRLDAWEWAWNMALEHPVTGGGFRVFVLNRPQYASGRYIEAHNSFFEMMAEHGFVGLGLFCCLLVGLYRTCAAVRRRARDHPGLLWAEHLARMVQVGMVAFVVGGSFVSVATSPFLYDFAAIAIGLRTVVERETAALQPIVTRLGPTPRQVA